MRKTSLFLISLSCAGLVLLGLMNVFAGKAHGDERFATPDATLETYIKALRKGDRSAVGECFDPPAADFHLPSPMPVDDYRIQRRIVYGADEVKDWNSKGIIPPAREGDVELQVREIIRGKLQMFSYNLRKITSGWKIYSHAAWGAD